MKNFARLVRFAWPYRARFGLSLVFAMLVAGLWSANITAVLPLLKILFYSENCQTWVADKITTLKTDLAAVDARLEEIQFLKALKGQGNLERVKNHFADVSNSLDAKAAKLRKIERETDDLSGMALSTKQTGLEKEILLRARQEVQVADARLKELKLYSQAYKNDPKAKIELVLDKRQQSLEKEKADLSSWLGRYEWMQPRINKYLPDKAFQTLSLLLALVILGVALKCFFMFLQEVLVADVMQLTLFDVRNLFYRRTMALDLSSFSDQGSAELISRFTNDMDSVAQGLNTLLGKVIREPLRALSCLGVAMALNWRLTCLTLVLVPVSAFTANRAGKIMKRAVRKSLESMSNIYKILQETLQGIVLVKAYTQERRERRRFFLETKSLYKKSVRVATIDALSDPVLEMLALSTVSIALLAGSYLVLNRTIYLDLWFLKLQVASEPMAIEDLLFLYATLAGISDPVRKLANVHSRIQRAAAAADRICALMDREPTVADKPNAVRLHRHRGQIEFEDVVFGYNDRDTIIRGVNLTARHGETIALVGPNGCGKSTLMNLLPRFWDIKSGSIKIDGHDLRDVSLRSLRSQIGMVIQETILFEDTVANNIAYGNRHAPRSAIIAAARRAYADQFISNLPKGYDTVIGERGLGLSGGQRQRLALARAMLRDPAILILDEATSAVDIQDEALIRKAIEEFAVGRTTFLITHSLGSLQFADRIVLMNAGKIDSIGTETELRRSSKLYQRLHEIHFHRESA